MENESKLILVENEMETINHALGALKFSWMFWFPLKFYLIICYAFFLKVKFDNSFYPIHFPNFATIQEFFRKVWTLILNYPENQMKIGFGKSNNDSASKHNKSPLLRSSEPS